jgi:HJR/Mrr/RecB family endonuclease
MIQQLDFSTIFLNLITGLPWWVYPILFIAVFLKNYKPKKKTKLKYEFKENKKAVKVEKSTNTLSNEEKKIKGDEYEKFVAEHFRKEGYYVWEHGQEKGKQDGGIDLFIKKGKDTYFVQCKNWENWKINHDTVQAVQTKVRNYMTENPNW